MAFTILDKPTPDPFPSLNDAQKNAISDIYVTTNNWNAVKDSKTVADLGDGKYVPSSICSQYFNKINSIVSYCSSLMQGTIVVTPAVLDEDGVVITQVVYNTKPTTLAKLKTEAHKGYTECSQVPFEYLIDKMIENSTVEKTFTAYKAHFDSITQ